MLGYLNWTISSGKEESKVLIDVQCFLANLHNISCTLPSIVSFENGSEDRLNVVNLLNY